MNRAAVWLLLVLLSGWHDDPDLYFSDHEDQPAIVVPRLKNQESVEIYPNYLGGDTIRRGFGLDDERTVCFPTYLGGWKCRRD